MFNPAGTTGSSSSGTNDPTPLSSSATRSRIAFSGPVNSRRHTAQGASALLANPPSPTLTPLLTRPLSFPPSVDPNANIIFGALVDDTIDDDSISITVLATGFRLSEKEEAALDKGSALFGNVNRGAVAAVEEEKRGRGGGGGSDIPDFLKGLKRR